MSLFLPKGRLSVSQIKTYTKCPHLYKKQYIDGESEITPHLVVGGAAHAALEYAYTEIMEGRPTPEAEEVIQVFRKAYAEGKDSITNWTDKDEDFFLKTAEGQIALHLEHITPYIENVQSIEEELYLEVSGVPILGYVDLRTTDFVLDHKFRFNTSKPSLDVNDDIQLTLYSYATGNSKVGFIYHWLSASKDGSYRPKVMIETAVRADSNYDNLKSTVRSVAEAISQNYLENYFPRIEKHKCPGYCPFYNECWGDTKTASNNRTVIYSQEEIDFLEKINIYGGF